MDYKEWISKVGGKVGDCKYTECTHCGCYKAGGECCWCGKEPPVPEWYEQPRAYIPHIRS